MKKTSIAIILPIVLVSILIFTFGIITSKNSYINFAEDGYVISSSNDNKYYFSYNNKYKINESSKSVELQDNNKEKVNVDESSFIHYVNGSIGTFKKTVILDLDKLNDESYHYYNFFPESIFSKVGNSYTVNYLDNKLTMNNFLLKVSENKYMVVSDNLEVIIADSTKNIKDNYLEITYIDGNIIKLDNQELTIKNISSSLTLKINDHVSIDLINKKILYDEVEKVNLSEITINSSDNIDIVQEEQNKEIIEDEEKTQESNKSKLPKLDDIEDGIVEVENDLIERVVDENSKIKDPTFLIQEFNVTANSLKAVIQVEDNEGILTGSRIVKIIESDTNKVVYYVQEDSGKFNINIDYEKLRPGTNYTLVVNQDYTKNDVTYNRDFIQKAFISSSLGIDVTKNYAKTNELSFKVSDLKDSNITKVNYRLYEKSSYLISEEDSPIYSGELNLEDSDELVFSSLKSDSVYTLIVDDFVYDNVVLQSGEVITTELKTLKRKPTIDKTSFSIDKLNSKFVINLNNVKDDDYGVLSYKVDIYDNDELVMTKTSAYNDKIEIPVDDQIIQRYTDYNVYVYLTFNDNEKEYEIPVGNEIVNMSSKKGPMVLDFEEEEITFERIKGNIVIEDEESLIDYSRNISLTYRSLSIGTGIKASRDFVLNQLSDKKAVLNVDINNLRSNESYLFVISAYIDYKDGNGYVYSDIGSIIINTKEPNKMTVNYENIATSSDIFRVRAKLTSLNENESTDLEASTMEQLSIRVHKADNYKCSTSLGENSNCWTSTKYDGNQDNYESELKTIYYDNYFEITPQSLNINEDELTYGLYKIEIFNAKDYTTDKNELPIVAGEFPIVANNVSGRYIDKNNPLIIESINNNETYSELNNDTIIGYKLTPKVMISNDELNNGFEITYHVYDASTNQEVYSKTKNNLNPIDALFNDNNSTNYVRGKSYYFIYNIKVRTVDENGNNIEFTETSSKSNTYYPKRQEPQLELYLSRRNEDDILTWNYRFKDIDNTIADNKIIYYIGSYETVSNRNEVTLIEDLQEHSFNISGVAGQLLSIYREVNLNDSQANVIVNDVDNMYFETRANITYARYTITPQETKVLFNVLVDDKYKKSLIKAKITFTALDGTTVVLDNYKINSSGEFSVDYYALKKLMGKGDITTQVEISYDNGLINMFDYSSNNSVVSASNEYFRDDYYTKIRTYQISEFNPLNKTISFVYNDQIVNYPITFNKGYLRSENITIDNKVIDFLVKKVSQVNGSCAQEDNCRFSFDAINPVFRLNEVKPGLTSAFIKPSIENLDEEIVEDMDVKIAIYNSSNNEVVTTKIVKLLDLINDGTTIDNLSSASEYKIRVKWIYNNQEYNFNYADNVEKYVFTTLDSIGIKNQDVAYVPSIDGRRNIRITYDVELSDEYDGIMYKIYDSQGNDISERFDLENESLESIINSNKHIERYIDISYKLSTNDDYIIKIIPYYNKNSEVKELNGTDLSLHTVISKPLIDVIKVTGKDDNVLNFRVLVTDAYNALFEHNTYKIYVKDMEKEYDNNLGDLVGDNYKTNTVYSLSSACESKRCQVNLVYDTNLNNDSEEYTQNVYTKNFTISNDSYLGDAVGVNTDSSKIRYAFSEYWNINKIEFMRYTITKKNGEHVISGDINPLVFEIDSETNHAYVTIVDSNGRNIQLPVGEYNIQMQFYWLDDSNATQRYKVIDKTVEYIKK